MSSPPESNRSKWFGLSAFLGTFLFFPIWDLFALGYAILTGWRARNAHRGKTHGDQATAILAYPIRRILLLLLAYAIALFGFSALKGTIGQPGPFGYVITGALHYANLAGDQACCDVSSVIAQGQPVAQLLADRIPATLRLLAATSVAAMILTALLTFVAILIYRFTQRRESLGLAIFSLVKLGAIRVFSATAVGLSLLGILFVAVRWKLLPFGGTFSARGPNGIPILELVRYLILPGLITALLPALISAQAGFRAWRSWIEEGHQGGDGWAILGMEIARTFYEQAGWIIGITLLIETMFAYPGVGQLFLNSIIARDPAVLVTVLALFPLWLLIARLRSTLTASALNAYRFHHASDKLDRRGSKHQPASQTPRQMQTIWLGIALFLVLVPVISIVRNSLFSSLDPMASDPQAVYAPRSPEHPLGTDRLGRDVQARIALGQRESGIMVLTGALTALILGGVWGGAAIALKKITGWKPVIGDTVADVLLIPADAAILLHPMIIVLMFTISRYGTPIGSTVQSIALIGSTIGLALAPRFARGMDDLWAAAPPDRSLRWRLGGFLLVMFTGAMFVIFQSSILVDFAGLGVQLPASSLGNLLTSYQDIMLGISATGLNNPQFYLLAVALTSAAGLPSMALYVLQDALLDFFGFQQKNFLPTLFQ